MARRPDTFLLSNQVENCQRALGDYEAVLQFDRLRVDLNRAYSFLQDAQRTGEAASITEVDRALYRAGREVHFADEALTPLYSVLDTPEVNEARVKVQGISDALREVAEQSSRGSLVPAVVRQLALEAVRAEDLVKSLTSRAIATCLANSMGA